MNHTTEQASPSRLAHLPVSFFSTVMGMSGLTIAWQKAHVVLGVSSLIGLSLAALSSLLEPIIIVFLGVIIGGLVVAMYLPIFNLGKVVG